MEKKFDNFLYRLSLVAGRVMVRGLTVGNNKAYKADNTPVTPADRFINKTAIDMAGKEFPNMEVLGEEQERKVCEAKYKLVLDPIDGTAPFCWGMPIATFCACVIDTSVEKVVSAIIYDPFCKRMWTAGEMTLLNGKAVRVSPVARLERSSIGVFWTADSDFSLWKAERKLKDLKATCTNPLTVAYLGGLIAWGRMEAVIFPWKHIWEIAPMHLIVEGAGGRATDIHGNPLRYGCNNKVEGFIISNGLIHDQLVKLVASCQ